MPDGAALHRTSNIRSIQMNVTLPFKTLGHALPQPDFYGDIESRMRLAHANHLGYPYNLVGANPVPDRLGDYLINNLGDPYVGSHYGSEVCDLERETINWLMDLWGCERKPDFWGSVVASGTEGNFWALYLAREALAQGTLIYSREVHYSIPKAARILRMNAVCVDCDPAGAIDLNAFAATVDSLGRTPIIVALTCGTTVKGAHDNLGAVVGILNSRRVSQDKRFIHVDGALNAMVIPFIAEAPRSIRPTFEHAIDSISTSGHKMIGTPMPCGALVARRQHVDRIASAIAYLRSNDTTLMGSRNGHAVLAMWSRLLGHGVAGYRGDVETCLERASGLATALRAHDVPVLLNPYSLTVVFPQPSEDIVKVYQLACHRGEAHAIVMPNVTGALLARFTDDYLGWWVNQH
jgi:histidine decarboxylase